MLFCDTNYAKWCKNWLVRKNPPKVTIYNENGLLVCRAIYRIKIARINQLDLSLLFSF